MEITRAKLASLAIAAIYVLITLAAMGPRPAAGSAVAAFLPLLLIWFPDELGDHASLFGGGRINQDSPPWAVAGLGWIFLLGGPVVLIWLASRG